MINNVQNETLKTSTIIVVLHEASSGGHAPNIIMFEVYFDRHLKSSFIFDQHSNFSKLPILFFFMLTPMINKHKLHSPSQHAQVGKVHVKVICLLTHLRIKSTSHTKTKSLRSYMNLLWIPCSCGPT